MKDEIFKRQYLNEHLTFGGMLQKLKMIHKSYQSRNDGFIPQIMFDFGGYSPIDDFNCYRGFYGDVVINFGHDFIRLNQFIEYCEDALGEDCVCRKGDIMTINEDSLVWIAEDNHDNTGTAVVDVLDVNSCVVIITRYKV
jgi:hypothetical protein